MTLKPSLSEIHPRGGCEGSNPAECQPSAPGPHKTAQIQEAQVGTIPSYCKGQCKEICSWSGKQMQWLQNLTMVIHMGLSPHFILNELEN